MIATCPVEHPVRHAGQSDADTGENPDLLAQRGTNRERVFFTISDYKLYLGLLPGHGAVWETAAGRGPAPNLAE